MSLMLSDFMKINDNYLDEIKPIFIESSKIVGELNNVKDTVYTLAYEFTENFDKDINSSEILHMFKQHITNNNLNLNSFIDLFTIPIYESCNYDYEYLIHRDALNQIDMNTKFEMAENILNSSEDEILNAINNNCYI